MDCFAYFDKRNSVRKSTILAGEFHPDFYTRFHRNRRTFRRVARQFQNGGFFKTLMQCIVKFGKLLVYTSGRIFKIYKIKCCRVMELLKISTLANEQYRSHSFKMVAL